MPSPKWLGVSVSMQSSIATAITITALTKANPGVATATNTFTNGDYVKIRAQGMTQVDNRVFRVAGVTGTTFQLEGEDTSLYTTFVSGTVEKLTLGTSFSTLKTVSGSGGEFDKIDATTIHDVTKKQEFGFSSAIEFSFDSFWDIADVALVAAIAASKLAADRAFLFGFATGQKMVFSGTVAASGIPTGSTGEKVTTKLSISATGVPTYYAT